MQVLKNVQTKTQTAQRTIFVNELTDGLLDPAVPMLGPVADGGIIVANTAPGCWGVVRVTFRAPLKALDECSLGDFPRNLYGL